MRNDNTTCLDSNEEYHDSKALDRQEIDEDDEYHVSFIDLENLNTIQIKRETTMSIATAHETNEDDEFHDSLSEIEESMDTLNNDKGIQEKFITGKGTNEDDIYYDSVTFIMKNLTDTSKDENTSKNSN